MSKDTLLTQYLIKVLANENSEEALKSLYVTYSDRIMRFLFMYVKSIETAEELTSDVFFAVWENRKKLLGVSDFNAYIYKLAKNKSLNYLRDQKVSYIELDEIQIDLFSCTETTPEDDLISKESICLINKAIEQLPGKCKLAFKLIREDKMKYKDAAEFLNISVKTLEAHLTAAMKKIKNSLNLE